MTQRRSDKHNPRIDAELDHDTAAVTHGAPVTSRSREDLRQEDPGEVYAADAALEPGVPPGMTADDVQLRSEIAVSLRPAVFPARRAQLVQAARDERASQGLIAALGQLPEDRVYRVVEEVIEALGEHGEDSSRRF
ncbi:MAG TPA: DUF2795 domain-containing protein [Acidimicrobiales bacterium]|nr:DUF2795 domain-containing protein [Acidimicrobiales bacterium]